MQEANVYSELSLRGDWETQSKGSPFPGLQRLQDECSPDRSSREVRQSWEGTVLRWGASLNLLSVKEAGLRSPGVYASLGWALQERVTIRICSHFPESTDLLVVLGLSTGVYTPAELTCLQRRDSAPIVLAKTQPKPPRVSTTVSLHLESQWEAEYTENQVPGPPV